MASRKKRKADPGDTAGSVLVVEDATDIRTILKMMIEPLGVNVFEASTGREGLAILKSQPIDVVISDLVMPEMSGMLLLHSMLELGLHVPFILISGHADKDSAIQALRLGAFDFLEKPVDENDLRAIVFEALSVGIEQRKLLGSLQRDHSQIEADGSDPRAELYIMKMRTLRYREQSPAEAVAETPENQNETPAPKNWSDLRSLFTNEAESQLTFCQAAIDAIERGDDAEREQAFLGRVIQSVRLASEAIRLNHIAELAWAVEAALASFRDRKSELKAAAPIVRAATHKLREMVTALEDQDIHNLKRRLDALASTASVSVLHRPA